MKKRVADFIVDFLAENGITQVFSVVGGGAMYLNNAFGINEKTNVIYNHHEQASAIAAESYSRVYNKTAAVCVTSGPGGTNALTGVLCAYLDNLPMIVISGQVRYNITVESTGLNLRQFGEQEYHIVKSAAPMTKYAVMVKDANSIKYHLSKALHLAQTGRRGPCWIDVPLDVQGQVIETDGLSAYTPVQTPKTDDGVIDKIISEIQNSERPVIIAGSSVRTSGCLDEFYALTDKLKLPVICPTSVVDVMANDDGHYYGMFGSFGGRAGNFIVQNSDLIIALGCRFSFKQIGFNFEKFSPSSRKIVVDVDSEELKKPTVSIDMPICADVSDIVHALNNRDFDCKFDKKQTWFSYCDFLKQKFKEWKYDKRDSISAYQFADVFYKKSDAHSITVLGNNCAAISMLQRGVRVRGQRMYGNVNCGTMGYDLPAAIGAGIASEDTVYCFTGEGSFQMNLQELQTIAHNKLPVKIVIFNNNSYQAIVQTQTNFFNAVFSGSTPDSGVSFPSVEKLAGVYGFPFRSISHSSDIDEAVDWLLKTNGFAMLELVQVESDPITPKLSSKKSDDGGIFSPPIDDIAPFLSAEEYLECKYENFAERITNERI